MCLPPHMQAWIHTQLYFALFQQDNPSQFCSHSAIYTCFQSYIWGPVKYMTVKPDSPDCLIVCLPPHPQAAAARSEEHRAAPVRGGGGPGHRSCEVLGWIRMPCAASLVLPCLVLRRLFRGGVYETALRCVTPSCPALPSPSLLQLPCPAQPCPSACLHFPAVPQAHVK